MPTRSAPPEPSAARLLLAADDDLFYQEKACRVSRRDRVVQGPVSQVVALRPGRQQEEIGLQPGLPDAATRDPQ